MRQTRALAGIVGTAAFVTACTVMSGLSVQQANTDPAEQTDGGKKKKDGEAASSSGMASSSGDPNKCNLLKEPAKVAADPGGTDVALTFAMRQLVPNNEGTPFGLDLDGLCTCFTPVGATAPGADACKRATAACDDPQNVGLDNAGSVLFRQISKSGGVNLVDTENSHVAAGQVGLLIHIEGYNGLANDNALNVRFIRSPGIAGGPNPDKQDTWPDSADSFASTDAYVTNNVLVARFEEVEVPFTISTPAPARMKGAIVTGGIVDGKIADLTVAGRTNTTELVNVVGQLEINIPGLFQGPLCQTIQGSDQYKGFGAAACKVSDMPTDPAKTGDLTTPCDAMSFGVKMLMIPATLGNPGQIVNGGDRCDGVDGYPLPCPNP